MGKGGGTQSKESDGELLCSRVSEFLPPFSPSCQHMVEILSAYMGPLWGPAMGGGGGNVLQGCGWVWGVVGDGWTGCSDTCERLPLSGKTFKRKPEAGAGHNTSQQKLPLCMQEVFWSMKYV